MKVLIADLFSQAAIVEMTNSGIEVLYNDKLAGDAFKVALEQF
jgi:hypothetical protein